MRKADDPRARRPAGMKKIDNTESDGKGFRWTFYKSVGALFYFINYKPKKEEKMKTLMKNKRKAVKRIRQRRM